MPQDPAQDTGVKLPPKPVIPSGREVYDSIMSEIEQELTSYVIKTLAEKYKGETEEEKKARMRRYQKAFAEYDKRYEKYIKKLREEVDAYKNESFELLEGINLKKEQDVLSDIESSISSL